MGKIVVKVVTAVGGAQASGGLADYAMLRQYKNDIQLLGTDIAEAQVSGGVLPITQAQYDLVVA